MKKLLGLWPFLLLLVVYFASYFNVDWLIVPILLGYGGVSNIQVLIIVELIGFLELLGGYKGWSGVRALTENLIRDDIEFLKQLKGEQQTKDFLGWLKVRIVREYFGFLHESGEYDKFKSKRWIFKRMDEISKWIWRAIKGGGLILIFVLGLIPVPGFRVAPDVFLGTSRWRIGFAVLAIANFLKTAAFVYGWRQIF